ncbi:MAG: ABC transporter permease [Gemmatimonadota bacterium]
MTVVQDLRQTLRMLRKNPVFTAAAVLTLALGIGMNTAVFSAVDALLLRPLPGVTHPDQLVQIYRTWPGDFDYGSNSVPHYYDIRERSHDAFSDMLAWNFTPASVSFAGEPELGMGQEVSANFFSVLGVHALRGRMFLPEEDKGPGEHPVVVLSYAYWQTRFGGDPATLGRSITINGRPFTVVGIAPAGFYGTMPVVHPDFWVPLMMQATMMPGHDWINERGSNFLTVVGRLKPGVTLERANEVMKSVQAGLREEYPDSYKDTGIKLVPQSQVGIAPQFRKAQVGLSTVIMAVVGLLLLIACVNVANLFLARASERRREMGIRLSLGARRGRIVRQLLTESVVFSLIAGAAGLLVALGAIRIANGIHLPTDFPVAFNLQLDKPVLFFTLVVAVGTGLLFGLAPAIQASKPELVSAVKGEASPKGEARSRLSRTLVVVQITMSILLLVSAGLFLRSLGRATALDKGFRSDHLLLATVYPALQGYDRAHADAFYGDLLQRVRALPGVRSAAMGAVVPMGFDNQQSSVSIPGYQPSPNELMSLDFNIVGTDYFKAMGVPILSGRGFTDQDNADGRPVLIINQHMAKRFWPSQDAIGKIVHAMGADREVVGVVANGKYRSLGEPQLDYMYFAEAQVYSPAMTLNVRTNGDPGSFVPRIRTAVRELDPEIPVFDVQTMDTHLGLALLPARMAGVVLGIFGALALFLAAIGVYGVMAYSVARRAREIGIRMALGADRSQVVKMVLGQGGRLVAIGTVIGLAGGFVVGHFVQGLLYGVPAADAATFIGVPVLLVGIALLATYLPARRAASIDPMQTIGRG